jgi:hypothetical protein
MSEITNKFFADKAIAALWDVAVSIKRGNPLPLDKDAVVHGMAELEALKISAVTYPGQIVAVIEDAVMDGEKVVSPETTTLYYFDHELNYHEVGKVPVGDDVSVEVNNEKISLYDFGKAYYEYVPEVKDQDGNVTSEAHYTKVEVSVEKPWKAGLEPKVVAENGKMVLGWYEPNPTTIEGINSQVSALQNSKADLTYVDENFAKKANTLAGYGITDAYTKAEVEGLVSSAGHLKRVTVVSLPAVADADKDTIYMVKKISNFQLTGDYYEEYMLIDGAFELIGNTYVDLSDYATTDYVDEKIGKPTEGETAASGIYVELEKKANAVDLNSKADKSDLDNYATSEDLTNGLADKVTTSGLATALEPYAKTEDVNTELGKKVDSSVYDQKMQALDKAIGAKLDSATYEAEKGSFATDEELRNAIGAPAEEGTEASGIYVNIYTKDEVNTKVNEKANSADVYTKSEADKAIADAVKSATGGESASDVLIALNNYKKAVNTEVWGSESIEDDAFTSTPSRIDNLAEKVDALEKVGSQANVIESITIDGTALPIENKAVALPGATADKMGLVKSSSDENQISVSADGTMAVNSVNVNKLVQTDGEYLILNGGGAIV